MGQLKEGVKAPDFEGVDQNGKTVRLKDFREKKLVLYFYPQDDTTTCTTEACNIRDNYRSFLENNYAVIGVSPDNEKSHQKFIKKYSLPFPLIADSSKKILNDYGVWGEKKLFGRDYLGVLRTTFIINEKGIIDKIISNVRSSEHSKQIFKLYDQ